MKWCVKEDFPWVINEWLPQNNAPQIQYKIIAIEEFSVVIEVMPLNRKQKHIP